MLNSFFHSLFPILFIVFVKNLKIEIPRIGLLGIFKWKNI